ncbi:uncharacterized protein BYT42DRAFT_294870 [Radiomyces spectabilis]|uniref:uncharacterized protein n=1 Tax=Radiomyces spectabilis TaxID=64574 RepID=UPI00221EFEC2|nr:uncharacterized protein BYT42DRAFT_294870 [Radiomyces spectabilis]KAI8381164.1 hypothetical protein BYT42DRAFT_294870 [Radiomyces spectabilis]
MYKLSHSSVLDTPSPPPTTQPAPNNGSAQAATNANPTSNTHSYPHHSPYQQQPHSTNSATGAAGDYSAYGASTSSSFYGGPTGEQWQSFTSQAPFADANLSRTSSATYLPGIIPLVPMTANPSQLQDVPSSADIVPVTLTDEQLQSLSTVTRDAIEHRLRILEQVQNQIFQTMQTLATVLSVVPGPGVGSSTTSEGANSEASAKRSETVAGQSTEEQNAEEPRGSRWKGKMPERGAE